MQPANKSDSVWFVDVLFDDWLWKRSNHIIKDDFSTPRSHPSFYWAQEVYIKHNTHWLRLMRLIERHPRGAVCAVFLLFLPLTWQIPRCRSASSEDDLPWLASPGGKSCFTYQILPGNGLILHNYILLISFIHFIHYNTIDVNIVFDTYCTHQNSWQPGEKLVLWTRVVDCTDQESNWHLVNPSIHQEPSPSIPKHLPCMAGYMALPTSTHPCHGICPAFWPWGNWRRSSPLDNSIPTLWSCLGARCSRRMVTRRLSAGEWNNFYVWGWVI